MQKKKENFRPLRSVTTFALAAAIITGSIYTVAAAVNYSAETEQAVTSDGVELANGDIVYAGLDENGKVLIADSNSVSNSQKSWDIETVLSQAKHSASSGGPLWLIQGLAGM